MVVERGDVSFQTLADGDVERSSSNLHGVPIGCVPSDVRPRPGHGPWSGGVLKMRVHSLNLGQALLEAPHLFRELAQLLGDYLVVIHVRT